MGQFEMFVCLMIEQHVVKNMHMSCSHGLLFRDSELR
jgi:hypothetical protein